MVSSETNHMSRWLLWLSGAAIMLGLAVEGPKLLDRFVELLSQSARQINPYSR